MSEGAQLLWAEIVFWFKVVGLGLCALFIIREIPREIRKADIRNWSDSKVKARREYLLAHGKCRWEQDFLSNEESRRIRMRLRQETEQTWSKYK